MPVAEPFCRHEDLAGTIYLAEMNERGLSGSHKVEPHDRTWVDQLGFLGAEVGA